MPLTITQKPLAEVAEILSAKTPIGSVLRTKEWQEDMPAALRAEAFMSAGVESVRVLQTFQSGLEDMLTLKVDPGHGGMATHRQALRDRIREMADAEGLRNPDPLKRNSIEDFGSRKRSNLIISMQVESAYEQARWRAGMDADALDARPAQELIRVRESRVPRKWERIWAASGGKTFGGRMIAIKTDPIWVAISRFGRPFPPFDFGSGMGLRNIGREESDALGLTQPGVPVPTEFYGKPSPSTPAGHAQELERSIKDLRPAFRSALKELFGDQISVDGDKVKWKGGSKEPASGRAAGQTLTISEINGRFEVFDGDTFLADFQTREEAEAFAGIS